MTTIESPSDQEPLARHSLWQTLREAIRGSHQNYTEGPIGRSILLLAVPMVLEMVLESVFAVSDIFFVAKLGPDAIATVGITESMLASVYAIALGLSIAGAATVARRIGEGDPSGAAHAAVQVLALGAFISVVIGIAGAVFAPQLLSVMGASPDVVRVGTPFTRIMLGGNATIMMLFLINAVFRGAGDAAIAMRVLWLANAINIVLGPLLIFGVGPFPEMGIAGAAVATTIGRGTGAIYAMSRLLRKGSRVSLVGQRLSLDPPLMMRLIRLASSGAFQVFIGMASWLGLIRILSGFGSAALAGYTIGIRIIVFALLPSWGLSNAAATMVGQALGAKKPDRAERAVWIAGFYNMCFLGVVGVAFVVLAAPIVHLFTSDAAVSVYATACLRTVAFGFLFYAYGMVLTQSFNGAGDTWTPTWINLVVFWLWEIPLAYALAIVFKLGPQGVFYSMTIAFSTLAVVSALIFRRGNWKTKSV